MTGLLRGVQFLVAKAKSCALNALAAEPAFLGIPDTVETRLRRFMPNSLAAELGKSWRKKARAFEKAGWIEAPGGAHFTATNTMSRGAWRRIIHA